MKIALKHVTLVSNGKILPQCRALPSAPLGVGVPSGPWSSGRSPDQDPGGSKRVQTPLRALVFGLNERKAFTTQ